MADLSPPLDLKILRSALLGNAAAFRCVTELQPAGGPGDKVFPPTYEGGGYSLEVAIALPDTFPAQNVVLDDSAAITNVTEACLATLSAFVAGRPTARRSAGGRCS